MKRRTRGSVAFGLALFASSVAFAIQTAYIDVNATVAAVPAPQVTLTWDSQASWTQIDIARRVMGSTGSSSWAARGTVYYPTNTFTDVLSPGTVYEYRVRRPYNGNFSTYKEVAAFVAVTLNAPLIDDRGGLLLVVDNTVTNALAGELQRLEMDLVGDGWTVQRLPFARHGAGTPPALRAAVSNAWAASSGSLKALYLFGHLPVVKSGYDAPDGHASIPQHTDGYYADINGAWTDAGTFGTVNLPGDGIYDPSYFPSKLELQAGRVDLADMSAYRKREIEQLRDYIHKSHAFRHGRRTEVGRRGLWNSGYMWPERSWINPLFGTANVTYAAFQPTLSTTPYLFGIDFGDWNGGGANYTDMPNKLIFGINFGSGKLYWSNANNAMRGLLAQPDWGLTCTWGARPSWFFHHMGAGLPVGYAALRTMNNWTSDRDYYPTGDYSWQAGNVQETLMGDPTLRLHPVPPPEAVSVARQGAEAVVAWQASPDGAVSGYHVYSSTNRLGPYARLTPAPVAALSFTNAASPGGAVYYQVRAIKRETAPAAVYTNASQGVFARLNADGTANRAPVAQGATVATAMNEAVEIPLAGSDADGDALTPILLKNPEHGELRWNGAQVVCLPALGYAGTDSVVFAMSDGVAESAPVTVPIDVAAGPNLLEWEFGSPSNTVAQSMDSTTNAAGILPATLTLGSALSLRTDLATLQDDAFCLTGAPVGGLNANGYIQWTVAPAANREMSLDGVSLGLWNYDSTAVLNAELRWSDDGFASSHTVELGAAHVRFAGPGNAAYQGMPFAGDLTGHAGLQGCTNAVTFRLYPWYATLSTLSGIGKLGAARPDLVISGVVGPLSPRAGRVQFGAAACVVDQSSHVTTVHVTRGAGSNGVVRVDCLTSNGTARAGQDYVPVATNLVWDDCDIGVRAVQLAVIDDDRPAGADKTVWLLLRNPAGGVSLGSPSNLVVQITATNELDTGLVAHWRLDETNGTVAADAAGGGLDGAVVNGTWSTGKINHGLHFNGASAYAVVPAAPALNIGAGETFSLAFWTRGLLFVRNDITLLSKRSGAGGYEVRFIPGNGNRFRVSAGAQTLTAAFSTVNPLDNQWHHVVAMRTATALELYADGILQNRTPSTDLADLSNTNALYMGRQADGGSWLNGDLDDVRLYRRALSPGVIQALAAGAADKDADSLPDAWEILRFGGTNMANATTDTDGDGASDAQERGAGTDPNQAASILRLGALGLGGSETGAVVRWHSVEGKTYRLDRSTNLVADLFSHRVATNLAAMPPMNVYTDLAATGEGPWFYRVGVAP